MRFPVVLHSNDGVCYSVTVPDLPGCVAQGNSFDSALDAALIAIDLHLQVMLDDNEILPLPQAIAKHQADYRFEGGVWAVLDADIRRFEGKAEKVTITLSKLQLTRIDNYVKAHGLTRSGFLSLAAQQAMRQGR
jgi:predicted RNase H-like HicB family nuclease